jgi:hypothetical protein
MASVFPSAVLALSIILVLLFQIFLISVAADSRKDKELGILPKVHTK